MQFKVILRVLGLLLALFSITMLLPLVVSILYEDSATVSFAVGFITTLIVGLAMYKSVSNEKAALRLRDGYLIVVLFWSVLGIFGSLPLYFSSDTDLTVAQAVFESVSGLTTTGATVIVGLDELPPSILFYRQELQWLGGMGIIVLAVAILPMLGIGGMQLYRAETPGPKKEKLTPRVAETAKVLWYIYLGLTIFCALCYYLAGMTPFDAITHSFSTVAIGGFSTHDNSIGYFDSRTIDLIAVVFMFISGINFSLHFVAIRSLAFKQYWQDSEAKFYCLILAGITLVVFSYLSTRLYGDYGDAFIYALFQTVSFATTTGFSTSGPAAIEYQAWPEFLPVLLLFASFVGGCSGSTGGGMKVIRILMLIKQGIRELTRMMHPNAKILVKIGNVPVAERTQEVVWGFLSAYIGLSIIFILGVMATGLDQETAFSAVAACMNNLGPGLGDVISNYSSLNSFSLWILSLAMLFGRLEIFTLLVLFTPAFWRN